MKISNISAYFVLHAKSYFRSRSAIFFQIAFPVILMLLFGAIFSGSSYTPSTLIVQNDSPSSVSWGIISAINESGLFHVKVIGENVNLHDYIINNSIGAALFIPANFTSAIYSGKQGYLVLQGEASPTVASTNFQMLNGIVTQVNYKFTNTSQRLVLSSQVASISSDKTVNYYVPGLIGFTVLTTMFNMVYQVPNYRKEKIFRQLSFSGLTKSEWMVANILHSFVMLIISDIIIVLIAIEVFGASLIFTPTTILLSGVIVFAGLIFFMGLGILAGLVSDNEETVSVVGNLILFPMMFLSGVFFPLAFAPQYLQIISKFLPLTYFITALNSTLIYGNYYTIYLQIILLALSSLIIFFVAARLFSWKQK